MSNGLLFVSLSGANKPTIFSDCPFLTCAKKFRSCFFVFFSLKNKCWTKICHIDYCHHWQSVSNLWFIFVYIYLDFHNYLKFMFWYFLNLFTKEKSMLCPWLFYVDDMLWGTTKKYFSYTNKCLLHFWISFAANI